MGTGGSAWLTGTTLFGNTLGLDTVNGGAITDYGDNKLIANTTDGAFTSTLTSPTLEGSPAPGAPGSPGAQGPAGPTGPSGPQGAKGDPAIKLLVATASSSLTAKAGAKVSLSYAATADAASTLTVKLGSKTVATVHGKARAGKNTIAWKGGKKTKKGSYKLLLSVVGADGQKAADTTTLKLTASA